MRIPTVLLYTSAVILGGIVFAPSHTLAGIIQAIVPAAVPVANKTGNSAKFQLGSGAVTNGHCGSFDGNGNLVDSGVACSSSGAGTPGSTLFSSTTQAGPDNTNAQTSVIGSVSGATTIPANTFTNGAILEVRAQGYYSLPAVADSLTLRVECGGTVLASGVLTPPAGAVTNGTWRMWLTITSIGTGAGGSFMTNGMAGLVGSTLSPSEAAILNTANVAYDFTTTCVMDVTAQWGAAQVGESITGTNVAAWIPGAPVINVAGLVGAIAGEGNGSKVQLFAGANPATNDCAKFDANHNLVTAGAACGAGGGGTFTPPYIVSGGNNYGPISLVTPPGAITGQTSTLNNGGTMNAGDVSCVVTSAAGFPAAPFVIQIGTENIRVGTKTGTTFSALTRAYDGTAAASHVDGSTVTLLLWQWVNQSTATGASTNGSISIAAPAGSGGASWRILKQLQPAVAYTVYAGFLANYADGCGARNGILFRESSSGKLVTLSVCSGKIELAAWNSPTSFSSNSGNGFILQGLTISSLGTFWLRIVNPLSGNRTAFYSSDGVNWIQLSTQAFNQFLISDEIGFGVDDENTTYGTAMQLFHWSVTTP